MGFFDDAPPPPPPPIPTPPPKPDWMGPPDGWLGGYVPERIVLGRGPEHLVTLGPMEAFATGVMLELNVTTRVPVHGPGMFAMQAEGAMRLGVAYPGGGKWQGAREFSPSFDPRREPTAPNIWFHGGGGGGNSQRHHLWLWPLPPDGPVTFALTWQEAGITETTAVVDGSVFRSAADRSEQLWTALTPEENQALVEEHFRSRRPGPPPGTGFRTTRLMTLGTPDEPPPETPTP